MDPAQAAELAATCHRPLEPLHSMIYFAPEAEAELVATGLRPGRMTYFASRSAPMGAVGPGTVTATFFSFNPELVARHIPRAWTLASPDEVVTARFAAADAVMRKRLGDTVSAPEVAEAAELAREAAEACFREGRPLFAGHADLEWPTEPHLVLWHAITLLREFRGDGHIAALVTHGLDGLSAVVTHTATGKGFTEQAAKATRGWSDEQWSAAVERLRNEGALDGKAALTEQGLALRRSIETATDMAATAPWLRLGADKATRLRDIGRTLARQVVAAGAFPSGVFAAR
ncbi:MAG: SCO6745 family protein [Haloechinothrix sp.]